MARLSLFLFGSPRIEYAGTSISFDTRKAIALLAYLALTHQQYSRDSIASLLWPDNDQSHARAALRRTLSTLKKAFTGSELDIDRETIGLDFRSDLQVDVYDFHSHLAKCRTHGHPANVVCSACLEPLTAAAALYQDDFLAGFSLRDSPNFDDWQFYQSEGLRRDLAGALERLISAQSAQGDLDAAIHSARRWLALDCLHEPAHRQLMQLYAWAGQRAAALHQYRECVQVLEQELGVAPLEVTTQLYQAIKENQLPPRPAQWPPSSLLANGQAPSGNVPTRARRPDVILSASPAPAAPTPTGGYPLIGRADELAALRSAYSASRASGQMVSIEGEAGIGKTRLAEEFLGNLRGNGATVIAARCYEGERRLAYGPIIATL